MVLRVTEPETLREAYEDFEATWLLSEELSGEKIQEVVEKMQKKAEAAERKEEEKAQERAYIKAEEARLNALNKSDPARIKLANRANQLLKRGGKKGDTCRALGKEFEAESDTQYSENLADSDLRELQPCALAHGGGRAVETGAEKDHVET